MVAVQVRARRWVQRRRAASSGLRDCPMPGPGQAPPWYSSSCSVSQKRDDPAQHRKPGPSSSLAWPFFRRLACHHFVPRHQLPDRAALPSKAGSQQSTRPGSHGALLVRRRPGEQPPHTRFRSCSMQDRAVTQTPANRTLTCKRASVTQSTSRVYAMAHAGVDVRRRKVWAEPRDWVW